MRLLPILRGARTPQNENKVPFQAILPLALKSKISGKGQKTSDVACLEEMAVLFVCLKENDFSEHLCMQHVERFKSCYNASLERKKLKKEQEAKGSVGMNAANASPTIVNRVLRQFPPSGKYR